MHIVYPAVIAALLFSVGVYGVLARRNAILVLMSVELMLNAVNLNLVAFDIWLKDRLHSGQALALFTIVIAAAEIGLGLAIILLLFRNRQTIDIDTLTTLADRDPVTGNGLGALETDALEADGLEASALETSALEADGLDAGAPSLTSPAVQAKTRAAE
jgi:NADH-quinone oxidoreductase subunit K